MKAAEATDAIECPHHSRADFAPNGKSVMKELRKSGIEKASNKCNRLLNPALPHPLGQAGQRGKPSTMAPTTIKYNASDKWAYEVQVPAKLSSACSSTCRQSSCACWPRACLSMRCSDSAGQPPVSSSLQPISALETETQIRACREEHVVRACTTALWSRLCDDACHSSSVTTPA